MENFQKWRDEKAKELKDIPDHEQRKEALDQLRNEVVYLATKLLGEIKKEYPKEFEKAQTEFTPNYESIESSEDWNVENISEIIPQEFKVFIELEFMRSFLEDQLFESVKEKLNDVHGKINNLIWREGYQTIMSTLFDEITKGNFSNAENFSHVIMPLGKNKVSYQLANDIRGTNFDISSTIRGYGGLWVMSGENTIFLGDPHRPLLIMSPDSKEARDFIKTAIISNPDEAITKMSPGEYGTLPIKEKDKNGKTIGYGFSSGDEFSYGYMNPLTPLLFLAKEPIFDAGKHTDGILLTYKNAYTEKNLSDRFKWEDVFNIVVDLKVGKVFWKKNKQEDEKEIEGDIEQYRKMLKDRFYFDFSNNE